MDLAFYGLSEPPFALTPDARFYFATAGQRKAMAYLGYGLAQGEGFVVVTGEIGAGKSTLVAHLMATVDPLRVTVGVVPAAQVGADDMLRLVAQAFGCPSESVSKAALGEALRAHFAAQVRSGRKVLLVVDEAQALPREALEELRFLSNLAEGSRALVQVLLLGQPEFRDRLEGDGSLEQLRQRVIASHHLDAMSAEETEGYVRHRLVCAGWSGRPVLTADAFEALHEASGGIPRRLNLIAARLLLHGALERKDALDALDVAAALSEDERARTTPVENAPAQAAQSAPVSAPEAVDDAALEWIRRVEALETQVREQDAAIRRMLSLMVGWVERPPHVQTQPDARAA